jgi:urea transport system permease protein
MSTTGADRTELPDQVQVPATVPADLLEEVAQADVDEHVEDNGAGGFLFFADRAELIAFVRHAAVFVLFAVALLNLPAALGDPTRVRQFAEYLCYAIIALGIDIAWGYGKMLTLGQGVFFGLGAYIMGMHLTLSNTSGGGLPSFMTLYSDYTELPWMWRPWGSVIVAGLGAVLIPVILAAGMGWLVFSRRIRGPFFALLTQATALIFALLMVDQLPWTAGTNGLTSFNTVFGRNKYAPDTPDFLYWLTAGGLLVAVLIAWQLVHSRFGRLLLAVRDSEDRVRFLGYNPALVKTVAFAVSAGMAGLAGALAAPVIGIVAPNMFTVLPSILMVCWVAVGGRGTLWGAIGGAILVSWTKTTVSESWPEQWLYVQGLLFIVVVGFLPAGLAGALRTLWARRPRRPVPTGSSALDPVTTGPNGPAMEVLR